MDRFVLQGFGGDDKEEEVDNVNKPNHYCFGRHEPIDVIEDWGLGFHLGNVVKYIARAGRKDDAALDKQKALWYLKRAVWWLEQEIEEETSNGNL